MAATVKCSPNLGESLIAIKLIKEKNHSRVYPMACLFVAFRSNGDDKIQIHLGDRSVYMSARKFETGLIEIGKSTLNSGALSLELGSCTE